MCIRLLAEHMCVIGTLITTTFLCKDKELILQLCKSLVRPRLEYCIQAWGPYLKKDINVLEGYKKEPQN